MAGPSSTASELVGIITSSDPARRDRAIDDICRGSSLATLLAESAALDAFRRTEGNLYSRVRALMFLFSIHRFHLPTKPGLSPHGSIPYRGYGLLLSRRFEEAIDLFLAEQKKNGPSDALSSALASAYHKLCFQTLADQVRHSVRSVRGNQWMFRIGHPADQPLRIRPELLTVTARGGYPILRELTPVRMDLSHSAWSDIFFLGMDFPEGARVLNISIDLAVHGRDDLPRPPVEAYFRVIDEPVLRLSSVDLGASTDIGELSEVFDFAKDHLGLLKAAIIAAGIIPPGIEGSGQSLQDLLAQIAGPGLGLELVSSVNNIPKGSRLAVSTNLLAGLISACMRATGQAHRLTGPLSEEERRLVVARAILGEWLGGSGGGWQDSGGLWPGIKIIEGARAEEGDTEFGISRGRLLPRHRILEGEEAPESTRKMLQESLVLVHGGMAQNVGPILEMCTEKYLLRSSREWENRHKAIGFMEEILRTLREGNLKGLADLTHFNFFGPLQAIIPWASNAYTERLIVRVQEEFHHDFWGFLMLGGMSGGGMGFFFAPHRKAEATERLKTIMLDTKKRMEVALPFAMDPVVYTFGINPHGTRADLLSGDGALMPQGYYTMLLPELLRRDPRDLSPARRGELETFSRACKLRPELGGLVPQLFERLLPRTTEGGSHDANLEGLLAENGFDAALHETIRTDLRAGRIGLSQNRLPPSTSIVDVAPGDVADFSRGTPLELQHLGAQALKNGEVAVITLAAGVGSRWTQGAGVVKALHPFFKFRGHHRTFIETHLAKSRRTGSTAGRMPEHIITTSHLTHDAIARTLEYFFNYRYTGPLVLSPGRSIGLRLVPMERDLRFAWEEVSHQVLDVQAQKVRESIQAALIQWARTTGEGSPYTANIPSQCLHPVGHWFEWANLLRNGVLENLLRQNPRLQYAMLHNIDTLGANLDPGLLGAHIESGTCLSFEVITRRLEDRGGGLARVNGLPRLVEGLALPREEDEFGLTYYNTMTTWIHLDKLLAVFGLTRADLGHAAKVAEAIRTMAGRMPTYVALKDVKKRWGHGQEDIFPVAQFEKLWSDMSALPGMECRYLSVPRLRGQQLKEQAQLDGWLRDGSADFVDCLCQWTS